MLSRVYQLSSDHNDVNYAVDPDNVLLWRASRRRLDVEAMRDAMLAVSGRLDIERPGASIIMTTKSGELGRSLSPDAFSAGNDNRSVYLPIVRQMTPQMFKVFDFAEPSNVKGRRDITTVATQALFLMNSQFVTRQAEAFVERLYADKNLDDAGRIRLAYVLAYARQPEEHERKRAIQYLDLGENDNSSQRANSQTQRKQAWKNLCHALLASAEFRYLN